MSTRKPGAARQQLITKKAAPKDFAPKARVAEQVKGGPNSHPWARLKGKKS